MKCAMCHEESNTRIRTFDRGSVSGEVNVTVAAALCGSCYDDLYRYVHRACANLADDVTAEMTEGFVLTR